MPVPPRPPQLCYCEMYKGLHPAHRRCRCRKPKCKEEMRTGYPHLHRGEYRRAKRTVSMPPKLTATEQQAYRTAMSDRVCHCDDMPKAHWAHKLCGCYDPDNCRQENRSGVPCLHRGQVGYLRQLIIKKRITSEAIEARFRAARNAPGYVSPSKAAWNAVVGAGMYSSDPAISHPAMLITGQRLLREQQQQTAVARAEDQRLADERMERQARIIAQETARAMFDEAERRGRI